MCALIVTFGHGKKNSSLGGRLRQLHPPKTMILDNCIRFIIYYLFKTHETLCFIVPKTIQGQRDLVRKSEATLLGASTQPFAR